MKPHYGGTQDHSPLFGSNSMVLLHVSAIIEQTLLPIGESINTNFKTFKRGHTRKMYCEATNLYLLNRLWLHSYPFILKNQLSSFLFCLFVSTKFSGNRTIISKVLIGQSCYFNANCKILNVSITLRRIYMHIHHVVGTNGTNTYWNNFI